MRKTILSGILLLLVGGIFVWGPAESQTPGAALFVPSAPLPPQIEKTNQAPVFGHPMVPGGIHNDAELDKVRHLYPNLGQALFTNLKHGVFAYVSYIKNGQVYWTKKPRFIKAGEPVIFDGHTWILQRCGNMLRFDEPAPVETLFDQPQDLYPPDFVPGDFVGPAPPRLPQVVIGDAPPGAVAEGPVIPAVHVPHDLFLSPGPTFNHPQVEPFPTRPVFQDSPIDTPEPSTGLDMGIGLMALLLIAQRCHQ